MPKQTYVTTLPSEKTGEPASGPELIRPFRIDTSAAWLDSLPCFESAALESWNIIFGQNRRISFKWPDHSLCTVALRTDMMPCPKDDHNAEQVIYSNKPDTMVQEVYRLPEDQGTELTIEARLGRHNISIILASAAFLELLDGPNAALLPPEIKCALLESYLENAVWTFEQASGLLISVTAVNYGSQKRPDRGYNLFFDLQREGGRWATSGHLSLDLHGLECLAGILKNKDHPLAWDQVDHVSIPLRFVLGSTHLHLSQINSLTGDDIVLLDGTMESNQTSIRVDVAGSPFWVLKRADNRLIVETRVEHAMKENVKKAEPTDQSVSDLEDIELELVFELGRKSMSLAEVRRIGPGYIFDLAGELSKPVSIYINGGCIGSGELVKIDNRLGVRLTHYLQRQNHGDR